MTKNDKKLDFWIQNNSNVLFIGKHGVGKTAMVKDAFDRNGLNFRYFSASTMDPWVDFVGVPREKTENKVPEELKIIKELAAISPQIALEWIQTNWKMSEQSSKSILDHALNREDGKSSLELVRPSSFNDDVEALFFDEFNRSPKKVRNAVMELLQFKSINGHKFPNLRVIWAAINPYDDESTYDVEQLDPAQKDRFQVSVEIKYEPNVEWFREIYGKKTADAAIEWWNDLSKEHKELISPRRLQYALDMFNKKGGDIRDVLPVVSNVTKLSNSLLNGPITDKLEKFMESKDIAEARTFLSNDNNYTASMKFIVKSETLTAFFLPLLPKEKLGVIMNDDDKMCNYILSNSGRIPIFNSVCKSILDANVNVRLAKKIRKTLNENEELSKSFVNLDNSPSDNYFASAKKKSDTWSKIIQNLTTMPVSTDQYAFSSDDYSAYREIETEIPQSMTGEEALQTLIVLDKISSRAKASDFANKRYQNLTSIVNHLFAQLSKNTGLNGKEIFLKHGKNFKNLMERINEAGLAVEIGVKNQSVDDYT